MNQDEINLIKSQKNKLEVCKEGIAFLRTFKNKKVIFLAHLLVKDCLQYNLS